MVRAGHAAPGATATCGREMPLAMSWAALPRVPLSAAPHRRASSRSLTA